MFFCIIIGKDFSSGSTQERFEYFFKVPGKYLHPNPIILSAKAINPKMTINEIIQLIAFIYFDVLNTSINFSSNLKKYFIIITKGAQ